MKNDAPGGRSAGQGVERGKREQVFLHDLFHKTKNPLQIILSAVNILEENPTQEERKKLYGVIRCNAYKINEILDALTPADKAIDIRGIGRRDKDGG